MRKKWEGKWVIVSHDMVGYFVEYLGKSGIKVKYLTVIGTKFGWLAGPNEFDADVIYDEYEPKKIDFRKAIKTIFIGPKGEARTTI